MELTMDNLKKTLEEYAFSYKEIARNEKIPYDTLFVGIGEDYQNRPWILNVRLFEQAAENPPEGAPKKLYFLNFLVTFSFTVHQSAFADIGRLLLLLNKILPVPGFGLSEMDRVVFYHYTHVSADGKIDPNLLVSLIAIIIHYINIHAKTFEEVGTRKKTLAAVLEESAISVGDEK